MGQTASVYRRPGDLLTARVFSDPPINTATVTKAGGSISLNGKAGWRANGAIGDAPDGAYTIGVRPHHVTPFQGAGTSVSVEGRVLITELSGSESVVHFDLGGQTWVSQSHGIHGFEVGSQARFYVDVSQAIFFGADERRIGHG